MPIPSQYDLCLPLLELTATSEETRLSDAEEHLANQFNLTKEERGERLLSGQTRIYNRVWWARHELKTAGFVESHRRSHIRITKKGRKILINPPEKIDHKFLMRIPVYAASISTTKKKTENSVVEDTGKSLNEIIDEAHEELENTLKSDILEKVINISPDSFERLIPKVLHAMGYGKTVDSSYHLGKSGDGGVDGVIYQDDLGLDRIYIQAKRYQEKNTVGPEAIRSFAGSLGENKAIKGVFVTTSSFTSGAEKAARKVDKHIVLINGKDFSQLMINHDIGCREKRSLHVRKLDEGFFDNIEDL